MVLVGQVLLWIINIYLWLLVIRAVLSWVPLLWSSFRPRGAAAMVIDWLARLTEPPLRLVRRLIRPLRLGGGGVSLDLSFIVLFVLLMVVQRMVVVVFF